MTFVSLGAREDGEISSPLQDAGEDGHGSAVPLRAGGKAGPSLCFGTMIYAAGDNAGGNPFAVLTAVVAPAILTNACSVLALGTSNRLARVVDRTRVVARELAALEAGGLDDSSTESSQGQSQRRAQSDYGSWAAQLKGLQARTRLLVKALRVIYGSLGLFATAALVSVIGSIVTYYGQRILFQVTAGLALLAGAVAVVGLASGCALMVHETRLAVDNLAEEAKMHTRLRR